MNHPSEWIKFFDECAGRYRFKHKGVSSATPLWPSEKCCKKCSTQVAKKTAEKVRQKLGEVAAEKGAKKIKQQLNNTERRIVVTKIELWIPKLLLSPEGQAFVNENYLKPTQWRYLKETVIPTGSRRDAVGQVQIFPGVKNAKQVFVFFQRSNKVNALSKNPYTFDTFKFNEQNDNSKLATCRLQYGTSFYPGLDYEGDGQTRIRRDLINYRYRKNDYNTGTQLNVANYSTLYPVIYVDLRATKESVTGDPKKLILYHRLNEAAANDYTIYAAVLNEEEFVLKQVENELVVG